MPCEVVGSGNPSGVDVRVQAVPGSCQGSTGIVSMGGRTGLTSRRGWTRRRGHASECCRYAPLVSKKQKKYRSAARAAGAGIVVEKAPRAAVPAETARRRLHGGSAVLGGVVGAPSLYPRSWSDSGQCARPSPGLLGRLRRPPGRDPRRLRADHRNRGVHGPGRTGHDEGALRQRGTRLLDRRQRLLAPQPQVHRPHGRPFPERILVHTPVHASWLNQSEIFFSVVQRKAVSPNDFTDLAEVRERLRGVEDRYNATAQPYQWRFTTSWTICRPDETGTHPPTDKENPPPHRQPDQSPKDFRSRAPRSLQPKPRHADSDP